MNKTTSDDRKKFLYQYAISRHWVCAHEIALKYGIADLVAMDFRNPIQMPIYEIEIKTNMADVYRDFTSKEPKHYQYSSCVQDDKFRLIPDYFYFCVPDEMKQKVPDYFASKKITYGVMALVEKTNGYGEYKYTCRDIAVIKRCRRITKDVDYSERNIKLLTRIASKSFVRYQRLILGE